MTIQILFNKWKCELFSFKVKLISNPVKTIKWLKLISKLI